LGDRGYSYASQHCERKMGKQGETSDDPDGFEDRHVIKEEQVGKCNVTNNLVPFPVGAQGEQHCDEDEEREASGQCSKSVFFGRLSS
jgi:uncharacterized RmlC-like cupin family protein